MAHLRLNSSFLVPVPLSVDTPICPPLSSSPPSQLICNKTSDAIDVQANRQLARLRLNSSFLVPLPLSVDGLRLDLDYRFLQAPKIAENQIQAGLKGEVFPHGSRQEAPFGPSPYDEDTGERRMVSRKGRDDGGMAASN